MEYEIGAEEQVSLAVVRAVSSTVGRDPCSIRPLAEVLDPDALNTLFSARESGERRQDQTVSFTYNECHVMVRNGELVTVQTLESDGALDHPTKSG